MSHKEEKDGTFSFNNQERNFRIAVDQEKFPTPFSDLQSLMFLVAFLYTILVLPVLNAELTNAEFSARLLDSVLQDYAFRAFVRPRTGIPYNGNVPSNFTGIKVAALRLRSGSMRRRGVSRYKEFHIPIGVLEQPYVERLVLVYHNLANWSNLYYPLTGYTHLTPVLGILSYDASNLSAKNLPELDIRSSEKPILVNFSSVKPVPMGLSPKCAYFNLDGAVEFDNILNGNVCKTTKQGHFSIVVEFTAAEPEPASGGGSGSGTEGHKSGRKKWVIFGSVVGGFVALVFLVLLIVCLKKYDKQKKIERMEEAADRDVPLLMTRVGHTKAPVASETRTRPSLENEYLP
ncbi:uncharacterized protein LOC132644083 [Lycium barbarum]|uniref:uncharacterized protein LOC132644083 n=1 Tax=Lycium barbarum TaxID=112863 RepID=UPI00293E3DF9|nr:uncharacterized protein LOC132644083 [Lycium barbarum]XP_060216620.1 uncharacterized protein LOC132644083 [Lycium barbarum]